jgi:hypothetical protein
MRRKSQRESKPAKHGAKNHRRKSKPAEIGIKLKDVNQNQPNAPSGNAGVQGGFLRHSKAKESGIKEKRRLGA